MNDRLPLQNFLHGAVVLAIGVVAGFFFAAAIVNARSADALRAWRVAHSAGITLGLLLLVTGAALPRLALGRRATAVLTSSLVVGAYSFALGTVVAALAGVRGLSSHGSTVNQVVFAAYLLGIGGVLLGLGLLILGAGAALAKGGSDGHRAA